MPGDTHLKLLCVVTFLCTLNTEAYSGYVSLALPNRRSNADYFTKCDFGSDLASLCDWTTDGLGTQMGTAEVNIPSQDIHPAFHLKSGLLNISVDSCLEFWYHKPSQKSAELKVFLTEGIQQTLLWSSDSAVNGDWRQVFVPLTAHPDESAQVIFELSQGLQKYDEPAFNRIGIRRGQCGIQCQPGAEFWPDETTLCTCTDKQLTCAHIPPSKDSGFGTCHVASDPHYTTFDGVSFHFEGPCTYILSRVCDKSELLPEFSVEVRNEKRGDLPVASVQQVNIIMEGLRVAMLRRERSRVMVNGIWMNLPLHLKGNAVIIEAQGDVVALHTDFQMSVLYTRSGTVQVTLPSSYSNRVCGMCGNFNQLTEDEFMDPNGSQVEDGRILGERWLADAECKDPIPPRVCTEPEEKEYASDHYCGVLTSRQGPFAECSSVLNIDNFLQSCMFHMCTTEGDPEALCNTIQTFIDACNKAGITVSAWRNSTFCPLVCGPQSHYNACASGCHDICSSLDTAGGCGICEERCECDDGFLVSGGTCVPAEDCGCWVNEQHYAIRETYMEANCERLCECLGNGNIRCSPVSCLPDEVCSVKDGVVGCFPSNPVTCRVYGDPHYITFDGKAYSFWGTCNYTIAKTCGPTVNQFAITARNEGRENSATSSLNSVALDMEGFHLTIRKNKLVHVNGNPVNLPADFGIFRLSQSGPYAQLDTSFGLRLLFDGKQRLFVQVDERYTGMMCGLCGTYSGSQFDDFLTPDGNTVAHPHEFGSSWDTHDTDWPCSNGSPDPPACDPDLENVAFKECSALFSDVFAECHWFVPPQIYVTSCISDYCTYQGDKSQLCNSLEDYVSACQLAEVFLTHWRNHTSCDLDPPPQPTDESKPTSSSESCTWSCNFDQGECGWQQLIQDSFDWTRWSGSTPSDITGPTNDHTTGNGFYMYIEGDSVVQGDSARIMSPACYASGKQCVKFWYHMYGQANAMALNIYLFENKRALKIWSKANNQGNHWLQGSVEIKPQEPFQIIVEGIRGSDPRSDVAIDDLVIFYGGCDDTSIEDQDSTTLVPPLSTSNSINPHPVCSLNCDFDGDICAWSQMPTDAFDWTRHTGSTPSLMTGPSSDHTTGSGFYMYIEGDSASYGDTARIISSECTDIQNQCLQFWYHMYGSGNTMGLSVYHLQGNVAKEVWKKRENQGDMWYRARVDLTPTGKFQVIFEGRRGSTSLSDVSIDDVSLHRGNCNDLPNPGVSLPPGPIPTTTRPTPTTTRPIETTTAPITTTTSGGGSAVCSLNCDFDGDICAWSQMPTDAFDWTRHTGSTPSLMTGPSSDHTTGSGFYMYIEGDSASYGDTARIISSECTDIQNQCLQFWYHMYGSGNTMGLSVYHLQGNVAKEVWKKRENQGDMWYRARVDLTPTGKFQVIFEGRRGSTSLSDVSIDDVSLHRGTCNDLPNPGVSLPPGPIPTTTRPTPTTTRPIETTTAPITTTTSGGGSAVCSLNCDFDGDICAWSQMPTDAFDWTRHTGSTPSLMTGPSSDHTTGSGFYMYIEGDSASYGDTARIISSECTDIQNQCLQFWYHMYGSGNTMGLSVYHLQGNVAKEVWKKRENQGDMWYRARVDLTPTGKFQVIFEGRRGSTSLSDVSIDDVSLHRGNCNDLPNPGVSLPPGPIPTTTRPTPTTTRPIETTTAPITTTTSGGGSAVCSLNCDFDGDICAWSQMPTDAFDWTRHTGSTPSLMTGPSSDHTTGSGFYMYIEGDSASYGDTARIISSECTDIQNQCLQFWYHMYGSGNTMGLSVYHLQGNVAKEVWKKRENQGDMWYRARVDLTPTGKFQVIFEGRRGSTSLSDVSIDDVSLHRGNCNDLPNPGVSLPPGPIPTTTRPTPTTTRPIETTTAPITTTTSGGGSAVCSLNCDFDGDICAWSQMPTDAFDWTRHTGSTPSLMTGPSSDHTTGSGFYMYIEGDSASYGDTARIISSECTDIQNQCLQFWYHMYGSGNTMGLSVYHLQGNVAKEVWKKRENQGDMWYRARVDLTPTGKFQVIFEGRRGSTSLSDVSIDDVSLHRGTCNDLPNPGVSLPPGPIPTTTRPTPTTTRPIETTTAPITTTTSGGGSAVCSLNCDFDGDICAWSQMPTDAFDWTRHTGSTPSLMTGPSSDHTTGSGS
ncbi:MAM and LDL-receptor class A domain-containing protein 1-like [Misgurnus anguillicaudatus]|uniref:MAM and LDL-receptor class A domain-containing protein 1-like n=1 Tax=Misgurnus anguillicaudatus TaxID=75329 RepID=UPI003CCFA422